MQEGPRQTPSSQAWYPGLVCMNYGDFTQHHCGKPQCMSSAKRARKRRTQHSLTSFLLEVEQRNSKMSKNGAGVGLHAVPEEASSDLPASRVNSEYNLSLSKADIDASLTAIYDKLVDKIEKEVHNCGPLAWDCQHRQPHRLTGDKTWWTLPGAQRPQKRLWKLSRLFLQAQVEDLDNKNRRHKIRVRCFTETVTDLMPGVSNIFHNLLPDKPLSAFTCDRIYRALRPKTTPKKPRKDIIMCMKYFLVKKDIMCASRNTPNINLDGKRLQIYPDISPATLDRRRRMKEVNKILQTARIKYRWGLSFKLSIHHIGQCTQCTQTTHRSSPIWSTPSTPPQPERSKKNAPLLSESSNIIEYFCFLRDVVFTNICFLPSYVVPDLIWSLPSGILLWQSMQKPTCTDLTRFGPEPHTYPRPSR